MSVFVQQAGCRCGFAGSGAWVVLSPIEQSIKRKIEAVGKPLRDWDVSINYGIKTGFNDAFIVTTQKRDEILAACRTEEEREKTAEILRPILRGRDIKRYSYEWADLWLIATFPSKHYDIEQYPAIKEHLLSFGMERLEQTGKEYVIDGQHIKARKKTNNKWFETQDSISYWEDFNKPKIVWAELARSGNAFAIDLNGNLVGNTGYILTIPDNDIDNLSFLLAFLNSRVILYCLNLISTRFDDNGWRWLRQFVELLLIPPCSNSEAHNRLIKIAKDTNATNQKTNSENINSIICEIMDFSEEERKYIDNALRGY